VVVPIPADEIGKIPLAVTVLVAVEILLLIVNLSAPYIEPSLVVIRISGCGAKKVLASKSVKFFNVSFITIFSISTWDGFRDEDCFSCWSAFSTNPNGSENNFFETWIEFCDSVSSTAVIACGICCISFLH